jgi:hypothetical protein
MGFYGRAATHKLKIIMHNAKHLEQQKCVLWSDESHFTIWQYGRIWVWRMPKVNATSLNA